LKPVLAGRSRAAIEALSKELACPHRVFSLEDQTATVLALQGMSGVLNCAGPFSATAGLMMQACLATHVHYFDITGEIEVFELARTLDGKAQRAGIVLCPGVGFDVVPTDCLAATLKQALPQAISLALGFETTSKLSAGTRQTAIESLGVGTWVRQQGKLLQLPHASKERTIDYGSGPKESVAMTWGDVSTAFHSTGIPAIEVYMPMKSQQIAALRRMNAFRPLLRISLLQHFLKYLVRRSSKPPITQVDPATQTLVWGEAVAADGARRVARVRTANPYSLTVYAALEILVDVLNSPRAPGFYTASRLMGANFIATLPGSTSIQITQ
jgi:short subunit dehydrogenase-like uncharacterized protein